ncbi:cysteine-rich CWC family protein [Pseudomonas sp. UBA4194]|uniref:cysteine-rich CWC family protein n=1 Tax=Pseudomonas sp. UBA4194 TaxID=1947317 RepID=UPI0025E17B90|nr:cysteine-rich CWC family protein [Pseudomonas sp. UBA4194]
MATPDTRLCPACGSRNDCTLAEPTTTAQNCWCYSVSIDRAVLEALPDNLRNAACLCPRCAQVDHQLRNSTHPVQP